MVRAKHIICSDSFMSKSSLLQLTNAPYEEELIKSSKMLNELFLDDKLVKNKYNEIRRVLYFAVTNKLCICHGKPEKILPGLLRIARAVQNRTIDIG